LLAKILRALVVLVLAWLAISAGAVLSLRWIDPPASAFMIRDRAVAWLEHDADYKLRYRWIDRSNISAQAKVAVIASEDQKFADHWGFDMDSINDALEKHARGRRLRGASTISQQVAKNLFLWPGQSWVRKGLEAYFTMLLEACLPKNRILEIYLNIAEFGKGVYGVSAASQLYFAKSASQVNAPEAALLAAVLPNPKRFLVNRPTSYVRARQAWIMGQMRELGGTSYLRRVE
jgi:monofunctional biosynthetic peptidoglycan transglycosylase